MTSGPLLFARYAWPPNRLGYCGPDDHAAVVEHAVAGVDDRALRGLLHGFEGAWPYLELIAHANGIADPLDARVVEAYWVGNTLLDRVPLTRLAASVDERFRPRAGARRWGHLAAALGPGARPHHSFHVLAVFPWVGLLRGGVVDEPLHALDSCRIRAGTVLREVDGQVLVRTRRLAWDGQRLALGDASLEAVTWPPFLGMPRPGERVALHWEWVCDRLDSARGAALDDATARTLTLVNATACGTAALA